MAQSPLTTAQSRQLGELVAIYPVARELGERFVDAGHELYLVGGTVRDTLLGRADAPDLDFATSARPEETERLLKGWADAVWLTGAAFGTVSGQKGDWKLEITTFRSDVYEPGSRHPEVTYGESIEQDLSRRDFTVNAMAVRVPDLEFVDPFRGLKDLHEKLLRTPVEPERSFADDPLRMVRLARFAAVLDARPDPAAQAAATVMADQLETISRERIRDELDKLLVAAHPSVGLDLLVETGLADRFLPELPALRLERDPLHHHKDVYKHTLAVVEGCPPDLILRMAALLHDIGKPATREFHPGGKVSFHHHEVVGARMAEKRLRELRYPKDTIDKVRDLVFLHLRFHGYTDQEWTDAAVRRYVRDAGSDEQVRRLNLLAKADVTTQNKAKARRLKSGVDDLERRIEELEAQEELDKIRPALDGNQIMAHLGLKPGPLVGQAWNFLLEERLERGPMDEAEAYGVLDEWAREQGL
jgi:poly(A) polymerase